MHNSFRSTTILIAILVVSALPAAAQEVVLEAVDSGFYSWDGEHSPGISNYLAGDVATSAANERRNFFVFDLSGVTSPVLGASLSIYNPSDPPDSGDGYRSPDPFETYAVFEITTDIGTLIGGGTGLTTVFDDLGGGIEYGSVDLTQADNGALVAVPLNGDAVTSINNAAGGLWAVGGAVTTLDGNPLQIVFGYTSDTMPRSLVLDLGGTVFTDDFEDGTTSAWSTTTR